MNPAAQFRGGTAVASPPRLTDRSMLSSNRNEFIVKGDEVERHSEGSLARKIEDYTAQLPSDTFLWAAGLSMAGSIGLCLAGDKHNALLVGQFAPVFLLLGVYNKIVKVAGSDRLHAGEGC